MVGEIGHGRWEDVSNEFRSHHWHHVDPSPSYLSIRLADESVEPLGGYGKGWTVEIYPDPDKDSDADDLMTRWYFSPSEYDDPESEAVEKVVELMDRHG